MGFRFQRRGGLIKRNALDIIGGTNQKLRRALLFGAAGILLLVLLAVFLKPKSQLMSAAEVQRITDRGILVVGVRSDMPPFANDGEGLEIELARLFSEYLLPQSESESTLKLIEVSAKTAATKLSDGSIDAAIALMEKGASSKYAYSYPYYTDSCLVAVNENAEARVRPLNELTIGYVQNTAGANVLSRYVSEHETKVKRTLIDRLRGRTPELPEGAITYTRHAFASYPDMLTALNQGRIDAAVLPGVYASLYSEQYSFVFRDEPLGNIEYAITVSADEPAIASLADVFLYELSESGKLAELLQKYGLSPQGASAE